MTTVKVECDCGQRYAFDVEPLHGRMPAPVACPLCGADGTPKANAILAASAPMPQAPVLIAPAPVAVAAAAPPAFAAPAPVAIAAPAPVPARSGLSLANPAVAVAASTPVAAGPPPIPRMPPTLPARPAAAKPARGKDGWNKPETLIHKIGSYTVSGPSILAAMIAGGIFGFEVDPMILGIIVAACGIAGGILNIIDRGPIWAGALVGLVTAFGGFGATWWWIQYREGAHRIWKIELAISFALGCAPGIGLQFLLQKLLKRKTVAA